MTLITHPDLVSKSGMSRSISPLFLSACMERAGHILIASNSGSDSPASCLFQISVVFQVVYSLANNIQSPFPHEKMGGFYAKKCTFAVGRAVITS
jgi:hypothetical protein